MTMAQTASRDSRKPRTFLLREFDAQKFKRNMRRADAAKIKQMAADTLRPALEDLERANEALKAEQFASRRKGDLMSDGTIFLGVSPSTGEEFYAMGRDCHLYQNFNGAAAHAKKQNNDKALGYGDWRVPTVKELAVMYSLQGTLVALPGIDTSTRTAAAGTGPRKAFRTGWARPSTSPPASRSRLTRPLHLPCGWCAARNRYYRLILMTDSKR
ncbi:MAG: hypothetical protein ACAH80_11430 [Alphaproteobacteria bacterium]